MDSSFPGSFSSLRVRSGSPTSLQVGKPATLQIAHASRRSVTCSPSFNTRISPQRHGERSRTSQFHCFISCKRRKESIRGRYPNASPFHLKTSSMSSTMRCASLSNATNPSKNSCCLYTILPRAMRSTCKLRIECGRSTCANFFVCQSAMTSATAQRRKRHAQRIRRVPQGRMPRDWRERAGSRSREYCFRFNDGCQW